MDFHISTWVLVRGNDVNVCVMFNCVNNTICSTGACNCSHIKNADPCFHSPSNLSPLSRDHRLCVYMCVCVFGVHMCRSLLWRTHWANETLGCMLCGSEGLSLLHQLYHLTHTGHTPHWEGCICVWKHRPIVLFTDKHTLPWNINTLRPPTDCLKGSPKNETI